MSTEFINTISASGADYSTHSAWESNTQCDIATARVFSVSSITGSAPPNNATVTGGTSGATGLTLGPAALNSDDQLLLDNVTGTFVSGETVTWSGGSAVLDDAGDDPIIVGESDLTQAVTGGLAIAGTTNTTADAYREIRSTASGTVKWGYLRTNNGFGVNVNEDYFRIVDFDGGSEGTTGADDGLRCSEPNIQIIRSKVQAGKVAGTQAIDNNDPGTIIRSSITVGGEYGIYSTNTAGPTVQNVTCYDPLASGLRSGASATGWVVQNVVAYAADNLDWNFAGTATTADHNAGETGTILGTDSVTLTGDPFVDSAAEDFTPTDGGQLDNTGIDLSATFDYDYFNEPWVTADIGAVKAASSSGVTLTLGVASEADSAIPLDIGVVQEIAFGIASEADSALPLTISSSLELTFGTASEMDSALALDIASGVSLTFGIATEADTALPLGIASNVGLTFGIAEEADSALPLTLGTTQTLTFGIAIENDSALALRIGDTSPFSRDENALHDAMRRYFDQSGYPGDLNDQTIQWLQMNGATSSNYNDAWMEMLNANLLSATGTWGDDWLRLLGVQGFTFGTLNDRAYSFFLSNANLIPET